jgi:metallo-beta-lactamase family protein
MQITFLGAARTVTGSCYMIEANDKKILVDCGMFQGSKYITSFNEKDFLFKPESIDAVFLTHAHIDHSGLLPKLVKQGFKGNIHCTRVTRELCDILLPDSGHIHESEAEFANRKGKRAGDKEVVPLYTVDDAYNSLKQFKTHDYDEEIEIYPGIKIKFRVAGHILGSAIIDLFITENDEETKLIFTGDVGRNNQPILKDPHQIAGADFIITESTYGDRMHPLVDKKEELIEIVKDTVARGGNIIIPAFAVGRTQSLLYYFQELMNKGIIEKIPIVVDSPMATKATKITLLNPDEYDDEATTIYKEKGGLVNLPNISFTQSVEESKALNQMPSPMIIISASGMADAGRVLHHLKHNLWREDSSIVIAGFQAEGTMGRRLIEGIKKVKIMGETIAVKAKIYNIQGFSAHADKRQLLDWYKHMDSKPEAFFVVHGEYLSAKSLADSISREIGKAAVIPQLGDKVIIHGKKWHIESTDIATDLPEMQEFKAYLDKFEKEYTEYKVRAEQIALRDSTKIAKLRKKLDKAKKTFDQLFKNV